MTILDIIFYLILLIIFRILYKYIIKPFLKLKMIEFKYKDQVFTFFYPVVGHFILFDKYKTKNPIKEMLGGYLEK